MGRDFCPALMDIDDAFGVKAAFQLVPEGRYAVPPRLLATIRERGFEVAVQDLNHDGRLFDDRDEFLSERSVLTAMGESTGRKVFERGCSIAGPNGVAPLNSPSIGRSRT